MLTSMHTMPISVVHQMRLLWSSVKADVRNSSVPAGL